MQPVGQEQACLCQQNLVHLQGLSLMTDSSKHSSLRSAQILVDRRNVQVSCLMPSLPQHTLRAHTEGDPFIQLSSGPLIIFRCRSWEAACWVSVPLLNGKGSGEEVLQHPAANMGSLVVVVLGGDLLKTSVLCDPVCTQRWVLAARVLSAEAAESVPCVGMREKIMETMMIQCNVCDGQKSLFRTGDCP